MAHGENNALGYMPMLLKTREQRQTRLFLKA
jgi:hypothetical protein